MVNMKSLPSLSRPGMKVEYPNIKRKKKDDEIMKKSIKRSGKLLDSKVEEVDLPGVTLKKKEKKIKMPKATNL